MLVIILTINIDTILILILIKASSDESLMEGILESYTLPPVFSLPDSSPIL